MFKYNGFALIRKRGILFKLVDRWDLTALPLKVHFFLHKGYYKMKRLVSIVLFLIFQICIISSCRETQQYLPELSMEQLEAAYAGHQEPSISHRRFKHADIVPLIKGRSRKFQVEELGKSIQGKEIYQLSYGRGATKVLLWSQMHGNESTATMALFDLFNFLEGGNDAFDSLRNLLKDKLSLRFIPMVNPDGADIFQRRNILDIDLNRDAMDEATPEAALLKAARADFQPAFGFNLHDQQIYYNAKGTDKPATISVLAPAYNEEKEINEVRKKSMQVIVGMNKILQQTVPGHVGKYDDAFEPRAFGDNFQRWGTSTILIESGGYPGDPEKQYIRQLNFMIILNAFYEIATENYQQYNVEEYFSIPDNDNKLMDLIVRQVKVEHGGQFFEVDLGIKQQEFQTNGSYRVSGSIVDKGDLSVFYGYEEVNAEGLEFKRGNVWKGTFPSLEAISEQKAIELLRQGYMGIIVKDEDKGKAHGLPLLVVTEEKAFQSGHQIGKPANFFLQKDDEPVYAIINGFVIDLKEPKLPISYQQVF